MFIVSTSLCLLVGTVAFFLSQYLKKKNQKYEDMSFVYSIAKQNFLAMYEKENPIY